MQTKRKKTKIQKSQTKTDEESDEESDEELDEESDEELDEEGSTDDSKEGSKAKKKIYNAYQEEYWKEVNKFFDRGSKEIYFKPNLNPHMHGSLLSKYFRKDFLLVAPHQQFGLVNLSIRIKG